MAKAKLPPRLVIHLCRALVAAGADRRIAYWIKIEQIREALGVPLDELDAAVACAVTNGLVRVNSLPAHSLTVTYDGLTLSLTAAWPTRKRRPPSRHN
jgi:hypothetical protein